MDGADSATKSAILSEMAEAETDPTIKAALSGKAALLSMQDTIKAGKQPIRSERK